MALNPYLAFRHDLYFEFFWFLLVSFWLYPKFRPFALALLVTSRQWAWVLAPFLCWAEMRRLSFFVYAAGTTIGLGLVFHLLLRGDWQTASEGIFAFHGAIAHETFGLDYGLSLAKLARRLTVQNYLVYAQIIWVAGVTWLAQKDSNSVKREYGWIALAGFVLLNGHFWNYFWLTPLLGFVLITIKDSPRQYSPEP